MTNASRDEERREARHTDANTEALREMALDTLQQSGQLVDQCRNGGRYQLTLLHHYHSCEITSALPTYQPISGGMDMIDIA